MIEGLNTLNAGCGVGDTKLIGKLLHQMTYRYGSGSLAKLLAIFSQVVLLCGGIFPSKYFVSVGITPELYDNFSMASRMIGK